MALKKSHTDSQDHTDTNAYHRIERILLTYSRSRGEILLLTYKDATARTDGKSPTDVNAYVVTSGIFTDTFGATAQDVLNINPQQAGYDYLKTLPAYSGAVDV